MKCPRCETAELAVRDRDGVTIDTCPGCRGVWLDRGELEKLLSRASYDPDDDLEEHRHEDHEHEGHGREGARHASGDWSGHGRGPRRRGWMERISELFD